MSNFDHFVGTRPVSEQHAFDIDTLTAWLTRNMEGFTGPMTVERFKGCPLYTTEAADEGINVDTGGLLKHKKNINQLLGCT